MLEENSLAITWRMSSGIAVTAGGEGVLIFSQEVIVEGGSAKFS